MTSSGRFAKVLVMVKKTALRAMVVSVDDIAARAYQIYMDRGRADGFDREDWLRAECELKAAHPPHLPAMKRRGTRDRRGAPRSRP
jgi:Protein of unknown function (DUF2934)